MLTLAFIYVRDVRAEEVLVLLTDWSHLVSLPRELFTDKEFAKLEHVERFTGFTNRTRMEEKLIVAGPFIID